LGVPLLHIDAFADAAFEGNPAAVCLLDRPVADAWMQSLAAEMQLPETAYVVEREGGDFDLRWFTPTVEVPLCGHATLASAHALWSTERAKATSPIRFHTASGVLACVQRDGLIEMDLPISRSSRVEVDPRLAAALRAEPIELWHGERFETAVFASAADIRALEPDFEAVATAAPDGVIATAPSDDGRADFVSRFFAPGVGIDEDPVTGAAHCALAPYWTERLGGDELTGYQASSRGGFVRCRVSGDRVLLGGSAVTVYAATLEVFG
jgi:PhzF family phenazine biosynthesis protein